MGEGVGVVNLYAAESQVFRDLCRERSVGLGHLAYGGMRFNFVVAGGAMWRVDNAASVVRQRIFLGPCGSVGGTRCRFKR